jgi:hypothetical protein
VARPLLDTRRESCDMKSMIDHIVRAFSAFVSSWSYDRWNPPYPGDGI